MRMPFQKMCMSLIVMGIVLSAGLLWAVPPESNTTNTETEIPRVLAKVQKDVQEILDGLSASLETAARDLAREEDLDTPQVRSVLGKLCGDAPRGYVVDCCTVDPAGRIVAMEPKTYKSHEGADIGMQEQVMRLHQTKRPVLSLNMPMVEGFDAVDLECPIMGEGGALKGSVSMLIRPEGLIADAVKPTIEGLPLNIWAMQKNGCIIHDTDKEEIGRNLFTDPLYKPYGQLIALGKRIADEPTGSGFYEFLKEESTDVVKKHAYWATVGLHGTEWRIVIVQAVAGDQPANAGAGAS